MPINMVFSTSYIQLSSHDMPFANFFEKCVDKRTRTEGAKIGLERESKVRESETRCGKEN